MAFTLQQLKNEITGDPVAMGYVGKQDGDIAALLNTVGLPAAAPSTVFKATTPIEDVIACIEPAEYAALAAASKDFLISVVLRAPRLKTGDATFRSRMGAIFTAGTGPISRAALIAVASRPSSRAEALWGEGTVITDQNVAQAKLLP